MPKITKLSKEYPKVECECLTPPLYIANFTAVDKSTKLSKS